MKNSPLRTSRRSESQATDSTRKGCSANRAATSALGQRPGHSPQNQKQRRRRHGVQQHIGQMVAGRIQAIQLAVEHVGEHRQRTPIAHRPTAERPGNARPRQPARDVRIVEDVNRIVPVQESLAECLAEHEQDGQDEESGDGNRTPRVCPMLGRELGESRLGRCSRHDEEWDVPCDESAPRGRERSPRRGARSSTNCNRTSPGMPVRAR